MSLLNIHKKIFTVAFCLQLYCLQSAGQIVNLSESANISLLTCDAGDELYSTFGHSALHVNDDSLGINIVFNYGTFDFDTPNFYMKFTNGNLDYLLSTSSYTNFLISYKYENRSVKESILKLNASEKQQLWERLVTNAQPENRAYRYNFFFDNCATRIRDVVFDVKGIQPTEFQSVDDGVSFRDYLHVCLPPATWTAQGIDIVLGLRTDYPASEYDRAFLPVYLDSLFVHAGVVESESMVVKTDKAASVYSFTFSDPLPIALLFLLFTIVVTAIEKRKNCVFRVYNVIVFSIFSLLSVFFWYMWLVTNHDATSYNIHVLWDSIFYIPLTIMLLRKRNHAKFYTVLVYVICASDVLFIMLNIFGLQYAPSMVYPIVAALFIRTITSLPPKKNVA